MMKNFVLLAGVFLLHFSFAVSETSFYEYCPDQGYAYNDECNHFYECYDDDWVYACPDEEECCVDDTCTVSCKSQVDYLGCYTNEYVDTCPDGEICCYDFEQCTHICREPNYYKDLCPENINFGLFDFLRFCPLDSLGLTDCCDYFQKCCKSSCLDLHVCSYTETKQAYCPPPEDVQCFCEQPDFECCESNLTCIENDQLCCYDTDGESCCQEPVYGYGNLVIAL